ncbi:MAG TPA: YkvA family protein [Marinobacter sp.]|nr:YkvA family protein [Marinobacter sp.]
MALFTRKNAEKQLKAESEKVRSETLEALLERQQAIENKVKSSGKLRRFSADIKLMFAMIRDYWKGNYRDVPWKSIAAIAGALIYVMNPIDFIPDFIIGIGFLDDVGVVALCLKLVESDLHRYAAWKEYTEENGPLSQV